MDYILESNYDLYLLEQISEQRKLERYINECIILSEGVDVINKIQNLNEGVGDKISEYWERFKTFIAKIWGKFMENFTKLANSDKGYVEKYKDIILKKPLKEEHFPIQMVDCPQGINHIVNAQLPIFAENLLDLIKTEDSDPNDAIKKKLIHTYDGKSDIVFVDYAKEYFMGGKVDKLKSFSAHEINMTDLYNFVFTFDKIKTNIEKDKNNLTKSIDSIQALMKKSIAPTTVAPATNTVGNADQQPSSGTGTAQQPAAPAQNSTVKKFPDQATKAKVEKARHMVTTPQATDADRALVAQYKGYTESFRFGGKNTTYSTVYESYIHELETADPKPGSTTTTAATTNGQNNVANAVSNNVDKNHNTNTAQQNADAVKKETDKSLEEKAKIYSTLCNNFLTAKMSAADFIKKEYMTIIRMHVKDYIGDDKTNDTGVRTATDNVAKVVIDDKTKNELLNMVKNVEASTADDTEKENLRRDVVSHLRKASPAFKGNYDEVKTLIGAPATAAK